MTIFPHDKYRLTFRRSLYLQFSDNPHYSVYSCIAFTQYYKDLKISFITKMAVYFLTKPIRNKLMQ